MLLNVARLTFSTALLTVYKFNKLLIIDPSHSEERQGFYGYRLVQAKIVV